jgi:hypothetical protein
MFCRIWHTRISYCTTPNFFHTIKPLLCLHCKVVRNFYQQYNNLRQHPWEEATKQAHWQISVSSLSTWAEDFHHEYGSTRRYWTPCTIRGSRKLSLIMIFLPISSNTVDALQKLWLDYLPHFNWWKKTQNVLHFALNSLEDSYYNEHTNESSVELNFSWLSKSLLKSIHLQAHLSWIICEPWSSHFFQYFTLTDQSWIHSDPKCNQSVLLTSHLPDAAALLTVVLGSIASWPDSLAVE